MKRKLFSCILALTMALTLLPTSAFAASGTAAYTVSGYGPNGEPFTLVTKDITFRHITETPSFSGPINNWYITYTRDKETNSYSGQKLYVLPAGGKIVVDGMRTGDDPTDWVSISAWSDPDNDGIFDQQIFKTSGDASPVPTLDKGPFEYRYDGSTKYGYVLSHLVLNSNSLDGDLDKGQATIEISTEFLTKLFGPNTIVQLELSTRGDTEDGGYGSYGQQYYSYYIPAAKSNPTSSFTDVAAGTYYADPVKWAVEKGITSGKTATAFAPGDTCNTAQILTFLWRSQGSPDTSSISDPFGGKISKNAYYYQALLWSYKNGLLSQTKLKEFNANKPCTRSDVVWYLWTLAGKPSVVKSCSFTDMPVDGGRKQAIVWAVDEGITGGVTNTSFNPDGICTRGQIVTFLYRAFKK